MPISALPRLVDASLMTGEINQHSKRPVSNRRGYLNRFVWFLTQKELAEAGTDPGETGFTVDRERG